MTDTAKSTPFISAIVPARNEEEVIAAGVESLAQQPEIGEILVVNDQSRDRTAEIVRELSAKYPRVRLLESSELPSGWIGKNHAVSLGAREAGGNWLLFTDADVLHGKKSVAKALDIAERHDASLISFSPEQLTETWFEKSLIPVVYCRLARKFSFDDVIDPQNTAAAANGQFLLITRRAYDTVGGHAAISGEVLEDVALARRVKDAGYMTWFGSGRGIVRVRMYRSFTAMWQGWKKNLYRLMGGEPGAMAAEIARALVPILLAVGIVVAAWWLTANWHSGVLVAFLCLAVWHALYARELRQNAYPTGLTWYGIPGKLLFVAVLFASYLSDRRGVLAWKGREYPVGTSGASKR